MSKFAEFDQVIPYEYTKNFDTGKVLKLKYGTEKVLINETDISSCKKIKLYDHLDVDYVVMKSGEKFYLSLTNGSLYDRIRKGG